MKIGKEILQRTTKCAKDYACINNDKHILCQVEEFHKDYYILKCLNDSECFYQMPFGYSHQICTCPTRGEIYNKYRI